MRGRLRTERPKARSFWLTLQIAWSGVAPSKENPDIVPRFPSLLQARFMAFQAIVHNARGLVFFGGHMTEVCTPDDAKAGWNWTFWRQVLRPLVHELSSSDLRPALLVPNAKTAVRTKPQSDIEMTCRRVGSFLYVIAVRRGGSPMLVEFLDCPSGEPASR